MMQTHSIVIYGLGEKAFQLISDLIANNYTSLIETIVIGVDKNIANDFSSEIEEICKINSINFCYKNELVEFKSKFCFAIGWRWLIKEKEGVQLIIFHDSLLPRYRGFAPLVSQLLNNENKVGVTALIASEEFDEGPIIHQESVEINYPILIQEAISLISPLYSKLGIYVCEKIKNRIDLVSNNQDETQATYSLWRDEEDYFIDWEMNSDQIERFVNAVGPPYKGAMCYLNNELITLTKVKAIGDLNIELRSTGKVLKLKDKKPIVVCKEGLLLIEEGFYVSNKTSIFPLKKYRSRFK